MKHFSPPLTPLTSAFVFALLESVELVASGERGVVVARTESVDSDPEYLVRYVNAAGVLSEIWWPESALVEAPSAAVRATITLH